MTVTNPNTLCPTCGEALRIVDGGEVFRMPMKRTSRYTNYECVQGHELPPNLRQVIE